jgi:hypothetical protein
MDCMTLLTRVVDRFRLLRCQLSVDEVWWERTERLDVCTVPVVRGEGCRWIQPRRWGGVSELAVVVDLDRWGVPFSWWRWFHRSWSSCMISDSMCDEHITPNRQTLDFIDFEAVLM